MKIKLITFFPNNQKKNNFSCPLKKCTTHWIKWIHVKIWAKGDIICSERVDIVVYSYKFIALIIYSIYSYI